MVESRVVKGEGEEWNDVDVGAREETRSALFVHSGDEERQARLDDSREGIGKGGGRGRRVEDETHLVSGL